MVKIGVLLFALGTALPLHAAQTAIGYQILEDFEARALGPTSINFCDVAFPDLDCLGVLSGGGIATETLAFPAFSGTQVYSGTSISLVIADAIDYSWPAVSARVTGSAPVRLQVWDYNPDTGLDDLVADLWTGSDAINTLLFAGTEAMPLYLTRLTFSSTAEFAIDDLRMGLENVLFGIPEPQSWVLLIIGFGLIGAMQRRQRRVAA